MAATNRIEVKKTYKLFINGAFPRSESGRVFEVLSKKGEFVANPCLASRKDLRDSVTAARAACVCVHRVWGWSGRSTAFAWWASRRGRSQTLSEGLVAVSSAKV